ncbi:maleylpyruvate isomerase family mycothiol-dependent enzyme [uncultured Friedmanniella sp.]|uniref:maleylpyruvate isomerase family mycothiol-dependent enzyme n=1 Tax=uncultured Friedmanniella sp. TaxID=335381 RepID=UPI0035C9ECBF
MPDAETLPDAVSEAAPAAAAGQQAQLASLRAELLEATSRLLGHTIAVADPDWRGPSRLPGWSRGHLATHIARQADGLGRLAGWARTGIRQDMYDSPEQREEQIDEGAGRSGLELQIDLDTSAGRLDRAFEELDEHGSWDAVVTLRGGLAVRARLLPLARLLEVVLHHVDLDTGYELSDVEPATADWLLEWCAFRLRERDEFPRLELVSDTTTIAVGSSGEPRTVRGPSADLLGWLTGRSDDAALTGGDGLRLPAF